MCIRMKIKVVGAGLAGCETAWQLARHGIDVTLIDIKPNTFTPAHQNSDFAELVCSNSLRAAGVENAVGLLKEELRSFSSLIMSCADATAVPAGGALAVARDAFSRLVTEKILAHPRITFETAQIDRVPQDEICVIATGPLTLDALAEDIARLLGQPLSFFDASAPIVSFDSIDLSKAYFASRYNKGTSDYINCPMSREEYLAFLTELRTADCVPLRDFENSRVFEGCMPVEVMAGRGEDTLRFGPLKPVGLSDPRTGKTPYAVVQLRKDDAAGTLYNLVGFQTHLKFPEQKRVFSMIPGLEQAKFARYGVMHRNTFINAPGRLSPVYETICRRGLFFAGQITGVEGYVESTASGLVAGVNAARLSRGKPYVDFPAPTATGALAHYISNPKQTDFQPMNINFGLMNSDNLPVRKRKDRRAYLSQRALDISAALAKDIETSIEHI